MARDTNRGPEETELANEKSKALKNLDEQQGRKGQQKDDIKFIEDADGNEIFIMVDEKQKMAKGGRAGFKSGSKGCKLAMKGKGRAYGKNS